MIINIQTRGVISMYKNLFLFLTILILTLSLCGCGENSDNTKNDTNNKNTPLTETTDNTKDDTETMTDVPENSTDKPTDTRKKLQGKITGVGEFSEGLAFVSIDNNQDTTYCIDKKGYIVFEVRQDITSRGTIDAKFINGLAYLEADGSLCDASGNVTLPSDVDVTTFYPNALEGGYILAEKITSDYASTKKELGIMDTSFKWIVAPSEDLHKKICNEFGTLALDTPGINNPNDFYFDNFLYIDALNTVLDLKQGDLVTDGEINFPAFAWESYPDGSYILNDEVMLKIDFTNLSSTGHFVEEKAIILFYNKDSRLSYFSVIDKQGNLLFEPVELDSKEYSSYNFKTDGDIILFASDSFGSDYTISTYTLNGELLNSMNINVFNKYGNYSHEISDGVIVVCCGYNQSSFQGAYYDAKTFEPLF